jgi:alpha-mannosidase
VEATKFATGLTQPLVVTRSTGKDLSVPMLQLDSKNIVVLVLKPSEDGKAFILTLFNPSDKPEKTSLHWLSSVKATYYSNTGEAVLAPVYGAIGIAPLDAVTLRVER